MCVTLLIRTCDMTRSCLLTTRPKFNLGDMVIFIFMQNIFDMYDM